MGFAGQYLKKQKGFVPRVNDLPSEKLGFVVVIPVYCEPDITGTLDSLWNCTRPRCHTEVLLVINSAANSAPEILLQNRKTIGIAAQWIREHPDPALCFRIINYPDMPEKDAGVGFARKTGMDEAICRFDMISNPNGYILSFDADSTCDPDYFTAIEGAVNKYPSLKGFTVYFEHPVSGAAFPEEVYQGIIHYELHLRYVNQFLRFCGFPFAYHTIGSCFGVRADIYAQQGGMNKRQAGEDFYFLNKIIPLGHFTDINTTRVIPSPRESFRVPFGTGTAISKFLATGNREFLTYEPKCFVELQLFFQQVPALFSKNSQDVSRIIDGLSPVLGNFLSEIHAVDSILEISNNSGSPAAFVNRFFRWFDAFRIVKFLNYASRNFYPQIPVGEAAKHFTSITGYAVHTENCSNLELLDLFRKIDRSG